MKKTAITLSAALMFGGLVGCGVANNDATDNNETTPVRFNDQENNGLGLRGVNNEDDTGNANDDALTENNDANTGVNDNAEGVDDNQDGDAADNNVENGTENIDGDLEGDVEGGLDDGTEGDINGDVEGNEDGEADEDLTGANDDTIEAPENPFDDVPSDVWFTESVRLAKEHGLVEGVGGGKFNPHESLTRAQMAKILQNMIEQGYLNENATGNGTENVQ